MKPFDASAEPACAPWTRRPFGARGQAGLTVVEVLVTVTVSLILLAGVMQVFVNSRQGYRIQEGLTRLNEEARFAISQLEYHLRMAGHWGGSTEIEFTSSYNDQCNIGVTSGAPNRLFANWEDIWSGASSRCTVAPYNTAGMQSTVLAVRFAVPEPVDDAALGENNYYLRSRVGDVGQVFRGNADRAALFGGTALADSSAADVANYPFEEVIYYVRRCTNPRWLSGTWCDSSDDTDRMLVRQRIWGPLAPPVQSGANEEVAGGVERMAIAFLVDTSGTGDEFRYMRAEAVTSNNFWNQVVGAHVQLLMRVQERDIGLPTYPTTIGMLYDPPYTVPADNVDFRHKLFSSTIQLRNG